MEKVHLIWRRGYEDVWEEGGTEILGVWVRVVFKIGKVKVEGVKSGYKTKGLIT